MKNHTPKMKTPRREENRDRKRTRDGWKAARTTARKNKERRRGFETGEES